MELSRIGLLSILIMLLLLDAASISRACPSGDGGTRCRACIESQMKTACPGCVPIMQCLSECLWNGSSRSKCTKQCDCNTNGYPHLPDCKKCLSQCKCSCSAPA
ncbi:uncharacterized protein LOC127254292 [Andrographis paniculata]|uniref:uncharacterized protein LOC127254292 n=1 Tax=Andrographis paniculata TaxID=175694 RepID=UPI0021E8988E|nr:uncharacterized protein LOC127254292 [Andrographis paniculata]